jgi:tetrapyrrole methylase family protein/MazG family protein
MLQITIVGLGPGKYNLVTNETASLLASKPVLLLRTMKHPAVAGLIDQEIQFDSYDYLYEKCATFDLVYESIARDCVERAKKYGQIVYAVPGSPMVAEKSVGLIRKLAAECGVNVVVLPGMSFLDLLYNRLGVDPIGGLTVMDAGDITKLSWGLENDLVITQVYNRQVASDTKLSLMEYYPDDYPITFTRNLGLDDEVVTTIPLFELDRMPDIDHLTSLYVPRRQLKNTSFSLEPLIDVMAKLRSPGGCVWDIEQTHRSLRRYIVEEVYEVLEAIDLADKDKLCEELGDLLLQIVFHARVAEESNCFTMQDVINTVTEKLIRRHPHVFGEVTVKDAAEVVVNWDKIKSREYNGERTGVLDGVPVGLPSLMRAFKLQAKAAKVGFDWNTAAPVWDKIQEELGELRQAVAEGNAAAIEEELGDVLFSVVNLARFVDTEPETALNVTNNKFYRRFVYIEKCLKDRGLEWKSMSLKQLDELWDEAKGKKSKGNL